MQTYDPNVDSLIQEIPLNEELARQALVREAEPAANTKSVPQGLLKKNVDESQMADFSTPIEEVLQNEVMGPAYGGAPQQAGPSAAMAAHSPRKEGGSSKNPMGLTEEQFQALLAGVAAVAAFSKPVQERLRTMVPKFVGESGEVSLTGLIVSALVAAIVFYFLKKLNLGAQL